MTEAQPVDPREIDDEDPTFRNNLATYLDSIEAALSVAELAAEKLAEADCEHARFWVGMAQVHATCAQAATTAWLAEQAQR